MEIPLYYSWYTSPAYQSGDEITVKGVRRRRDGTYTNNCRCGNETVFRVQTDAHGKPILVPIKEKK